MARGNMRGRGGNFRGNFRSRMGYIRHKLDRMLVPFDLAVCEGAFPSTKPQVEGATTPQNEDPELTAALLKRNTDLSPQPSEQTAISNLVTKVQTVLDNLVVAPGDFEACQLAEVRQVGSFKKGTMVTRHNVADIVVVFKTLPTKESVEALGVKVRDDLKNLMKNEVIPKGEQLSHSTNEKGLIIRNTFASVKVLITTTHVYNSKKIEPEIHLDRKMMLTHLASIRHARWFEENAQHASIKVLIRLLKDVKTRFEGFEPLTPWMMDLLAHYAIMHNPSRQALPISVAFKRVFQLLAAGLFLPGSAGIQDPCERIPIRVHSVIPLEKQDVLCLTAQTLLRVLSHGGFKQVLGLEGVGNIANEMSVWDGVVVSPLDKAYEPSEDKADENDENEDNNMEEGDQDESMETEQ